MPLLSKRPPNLSDARQRPDADHGRAEGAYALKTTGCSDRPAEQIGGSEPPSAGQRHSGWGAISWFSRSLLFDEGEFAEHHILNERTAQNAIAASTAAP